MNLTAPQQGFLEILSNCLVQDNVIRKKSEEQISIISQTNYQDVVYNCSEFFKSEQIKKEIRQLCATIIKNSLKTESNIHNWSIIDPTTKETIKSNVLACLGAPETEIRKGAALAVAAIAKIEIPNHQWQCLIDVLHSASQHENINYKLSALTTIGFICQDLSPNDFDLNERDKISQIIFTHLLAQNVNQIIINKYFMNFFENTSQKISSNVFEKCLECCEPEVKIQIISNICNPNMVKQLLFNMYGNYVLQKSMLASVEPYRSRFISMVAPLMNSLPAFPFGNIVIHKLINSFPELDTLRMQLYSQQKLCKNMYYNSIGKKNNNNKFTNNCTYFSKTSNY